MITNFSYKYIWISSTMKLLNPLMCYLCLLFCRWLNLPSYHLLSYSKPFSWKSSSGDMHMMKFITDSICSQFSKITEKFKPFCLIFFFLFSLDLQSEDKVLSLPFTCGSCHCLSNWSAAQFGWNYSLSSSHSNNLCWSNCILFFS